MEASPTLLINFFSGFKQNVVPLFQRQYSWTEKQWKTLWGDLLLFYDVDTRGQHFMGAIVTMPARAVPVGIPAKLNTIPEGSRTPFRAEGEHRRSEATLAL